MANLLPLLSSPINTITPTITNKSLDWTMMALFGWATVLNQAYVDNAEKIEADVVRKHTVFATIASNTITAAWNRGLEKGGTQ
jgi:hypothetical protein